jgi:hypothetical protein
VRFIALASSTKRCQQIADTNHSKGVIGSKHPDAARHERRHEHDRYDERQFDGVDASINVDLPVARPLRYGIPL